MSATREDREAIRDPGIQSSFADYLTFCKRASMLECLQLNATIGTFSILSHSFRIEQKAGNQIREKSARFFLGEVNLASKRFEFLSKLKIWNLPEKLRTCALSIPYSMKCKLLE